MGDPKRNRKKFQRPSHPWQRARIEEEAILVRKYGLKSKKELWRLETMLSNVKNQAKRLIPLNTPQAKKEEELILKRLKHLGLLIDSAKLEDILGINISNVLDRRLQSIVHKKGISKTPKQARQFVVHQHISIGDKLMTSPNYIVSTSEENQILFVQTSPFIDPNHPELVNKKVVLNKKVESKKEEEKLPGEVTEKDLKPFEVE